MTFLAALSIGQMLLAQIIGFAILVFVLAKFVWPFLKKVLDGRAASIEESFKKLEVDREAAGKELSEYKQNVGEVAQEAERRRKASLEEAERTRDQALADAKKQAEAALERARQEIRIERDKAVLELRREAESLTMQAADHLVQAAMNDSIDKKLVDGYLDRIDSVEKP